MEGARRAVKRTQSREERWSGLGEQLNALTVGRSGGGFRRAAYDTQNREEWWRVPGGQLNQYSEPGGVHR